MDEFYDVIIAGAGLAGVLAAARLNATKPDFKILLLEKEKAPGGRIRSSSPEKRHWSYGLNNISTALFDFWDQTIKDDPEAGGLPSYLTGRQETLGVLSGGKIATVPMNQMFSAQGARALAGGAAARDWSVVEKLVEGAEKGKKGEQAFAQAWGGTRKSPSALVLEHLASIWGIPDLWTANTSVVLGRASLYEEGLHKGDWEQAINELLDRPSFQEKITLKSSCLIVGADHVDDHWQLSTEQGDFKGKSLMIAQTPWDAVQWLPKRFWPPSLLHITSKTKPVSVLVLSCLITTEHELPDIVLIPAEGVQALVNGDNEICFQATLDYELTLQAPAVVKAVRRLRRARQKLAASLPSLKIEGDHLALLPVGWAQPPQQSDRRWVEKLERQDFHSNSLAFCGDAYGTSFDGDRNFINSIIAACGTIGC